MNIDIVVSEKAPATIGPYSQAVKVGDFIFCSGQIPLDPATGEIVSGDVSAQAEQVMSNIAAVLAAAGVGFDRAVKSTIYLVDMADFAAVNEEYGRCFPGHKPARSTVAVAALPRGARVEIELVAVI